MIRDRLLAISAAALLLTAALAMPAAATADAPPPARAKDAAAPAPTPPPKAPPADQPPLAEDAEPQPVYIDEIGKNGRLRTNVRVELSNAPTVDSVLSSLKNVAVFSASAIMLLLGSAAAGATLAGIVLLIRKHRESRAGG